MNTLIPSVSSRSKNIRSNRANPLGRARVNVTQAERLLQATMSPTVPAAELLPNLRTRALRQQIESAALSFLFVSIAITFGVLMTA